MKILAFAAFLTHLTERSHIPVTRARVCARERDKPGVPSDVSDRRGTPPNGGIKLSAVRTVFDQQSPPGQKRRSVSLLADVKSAIRWAFAGRAWPSMVSRAGNKIPRRYLANRQMAVCPSPPPGISEQGGLVGAGGNCSNPPTQNGGVFFHRSRISGRLPERSLLIYRHNARARACRQAIVFEAPR